MTVFTDQMMEPKKADSSFIRAARFPVQDNFGTSTECFCPPKGWLGRLGSRRPPSTSKAELKNQLETLQEEVAELHEAARQHRAQHLRVSRFHILLAGRCVPAPCSQADQVHLQMVQDLESMRGQRDAAQMRDAASTKVWHQVSLRCLAIM